MEDRLLRGGAKFDSAPFNDYLREQGASEAANDLLVALGELEGRPHLHAVDAARNRVRVAGENTFQDRGRQRPTAARLRRRAQGPHPLRNRGARVGAGRDIECAPSRTFAPALRHLPTGPSSPRFPSSVARHRSRAGLLAPKGRVIPTLLRLQLRRPYNAARATGRERLRSLSPLGPHSRIHIHTRSDGPRSLWSRYTKRQIADEVGAMPAEAAIASSSTKSSARPGSRPISKPCTSRSGTRIRGPAARGITGPRTNVRESWVDAGKPEGRIHSAGEHLSHFQGWMQGALQSGLRLSATNCPILEAALVGAFTDFEDAVIYEAARHVDAQAISTRIHAISNGQTFPYTHPQSCCTCWQANRETGARRDIAEPGCFTCRGGRQAFGSPSPAQVSAASPGRCASGRTRQLSRELLPAASAGRTRSSRPMPLRGTA